MPFVDRKAMGSDQFFYSFCIGEGPVFFWLHVGRQGRRRMARKPLLYPPPPPNSLTTDLDQDVSYKRLGTGNWVYTRYPARLYGPQPPSSAFKVA